MSSSPDPNEPERDAPRATFEEPARATSEAEPEASGAPREAEPVASPPLAGAPPDAETEPPSEEFARALQTYDAGDGAASRAATTTPRVGAKVRGTVVAITGEHVMLDIGARSEASTEIGPFRNEDGTLRVAAGDELELFVVEAGDAIVLASSVDAAKGRGGASLDRVREARASGMPVTGKVTAVNAGGLEVELGGVRGFCPVSQIELGYCSDPSVYVGRSLEFHVTRLEEERRSVVLSRRELLRREQTAQSRQRIAALKIGDEVEGKVRRLEPFGAFVDIGGVDALVHVSEVSLTRIAHPKDALRVGEVIRARVLRIEAGKDGKPRIALSIKSLSPDPWEGVESRLSPGARVHGTVARLTEFGAFVTLEPGVDGLVHISEIAPQRVERIRDLLSVGQQVDAIVMGVDPTKKRVSLSIRRAAEGYAGEAEPRPREPRRGAPRDQGTSSPGDPGSMPPRGEGRGGPRGESRGGGRDQARGPRGQGRGGPRELGREGPRGSGRSGPRDQGRREGRDSGWRESRPGRRESEESVRREARPDPVTHHPAPRSDEPTTMAIALRKAMEKLRQQPKTP